MSYNSGENLIYKNKTRPVSRPQPANLFNVDNEVKKNKIKKVGKIGEGTYGCVYHAVDDDNSSLAIKRNTIPNIYYNTSVNIRELDILLIVSEHPFCIKLLNYYFENPFVDSALSPLASKDSLNDKIFFAMEKGEMDTSQWLAMGQATIPDKKLFMLQMLLSLEFLHSRNIYHRDIKPANIILFFDSMNNTSKKGVQNKNMPTLVNTKKLKCAKLSDFGLSQFYSTQPMAINNVVTIWYRAPEIALNKHHDTKVDVWSLGCIFFELFSNGGNKRLCEPKDDEQLIVFLARNFHMSKEDYILSHTLYRNQITHAKDYELIQKKIPDIQDLFKFDTKFLKYFDALEVDGQPNHGIESVDRPTATITNYFDLIRNMLMTDPNKRFSATQCLNHPFFKGYENYIDHHRALFDINRKDGTWMGQLPCFFVYNNDKNREIAMKWFNLIYSARTEHPICIWYSNRLFFHAIDIYDRFMVKSGEATKTTLPENRILIIVITCLFLSSKYFRVMLDSVGLTYFIIGFAQQHQPLVIKNVEELEEHMLKDIFKCRLYFPTIYEQATEHLSEIAIRRLLEIISKCELESGITVEECWQQIAPEIRRINSATVESNLLYPNVDVSGL